MKLIVGLGNPGKKYERTRHNLGFMAVEQFLKDYEPVRKTVWTNEPKFKSDIVELEWQSQNGTGLQKVILVKPKTYMNNSGLAVRLLSTAYRLQTRDIWIVHDDIDLPLGSMKIRLGGAAGGHHGVESVIQHLGTDKFWRFRLGIGQLNSKFKVEPFDSFDFAQDRSTQGRRSKFSRRIIKNTEQIVLSPFSGGERGKVRELIKRGSKALQLALEEGLEAAQNRYNTK